MPDRLRHSGGEHTGILPSSVDPKACPERATEQPAAAVQAPTYDERWFQELIDDLHAIVWEIALPSWRFTYVNERATAVLGYPAQRWLCERDFWVNQLHPGDRLSAVNRRVKCVQRGEDHVLDYRAVTATGETVWLHDVVCVLKDAAGRPERLRGITIDVTERTRLEESQGRLAAIVESSRDAIVSTLVDGTVTSWNGAAERLFGCRAKEALGRPIEMLVPSKSRGAFENLVQTVVSGGQLWNFEVSREQASGEETHLSLTLSPIRNNLEEVIGISVIARDVTHRKQTENSLRKSQERFDELLRSLDDVVWSAQADEMLYVNPATETVYGRSVEEFKQNGNLWLDVVHPADRDRVTRGAAELLARGQASLEYRIVRPNGEVRWIHDRKSVILDAAGRPLRMGGIATDITDRKHAEEQLRNREIELAHVSRLSTMGEMVAGIAHEVNQPLHAISNYASACQRMIGSGTGQDPEVAAELCREIGEQAVRAGEIIRRLRNFVRKSAPAGVTFDLNAAVRDSVEMLTFSARHHDVSIAMELSEAPATVQADEVQIQQVVVNLLRNAIEAMCDMAAGERVATVRTVLENAEVEFSAADCGPGISEDTRNRAFDAFYTTKESGLGMGLAISRTIVEAHGGRIWLTPGVPGGTVAHFSLPHIQIERPADLPAGIETGCEEVP